MNFREKRRHSVDQIEVGRLQYGTTVQYNGSYYIKVNKVKLGEGVILHYPHSTSVLCNLKLGTLRALSGDAVVSVIDVDAEVSLGIAAEAVK